MSDPTRRRTFAAKYRHRAWGVILAIPASLATILSVGFFIGCIVTWGTYYLPSAITFLIPALAFGLPAVYLLRGRDTDPRPAARKAAAAARHEAQVAGREAERAARQAELLSRQQTAEAQRDAAVAQREAAQADAQAAEARRLASIADRQVVALDAADEATLASPETSLAAPANAAEWAAQELTLNRIAGYMRASGILWLILGIIQVAVGVGFAFAAGLTLTLVIVGVWNIVAATSRLNSVALIKARDSSVPGSWEGIAGLVIVGVANLVIGGLVGVAFVIFDFVVRDHILKNRSLFTRTPEAVQSPPQPHSVA